MCEGVLREFITILGDHKAPSHYWIEYMEPLASGGESRAGAGAPEDEAPGLLLSTGCWSCLHGGRGSEPGILEGPSPTGPVHTWHHMLPAHPHPARAVTEMRFLSQAACSGPG